MLSDIGQPGATRKQVGRFIHLAKNWKELCPMATPSGANKDGIFRIGGNVVDLAL